MRFIFVFILGFSVIGSSGFAQTNAKGTDTKMGHCDADAIMEVLLADLPGNDELIAMAKTKAEQLSLLEEELKLMVTELAKDSATLDKVLYDFRANDIVYKENLIEEYRVICQQELAQKKMQVFKPAEAKFTLAVRQSADEHDVNYIVDSVTNKVLFDLTGNADNGKEVEISAESVDLQQAILEKL